MYVCLNSGGKKCERGGGGNSAVGNRGGDKRPGSFVAPRYLIWKGLMDQQVDNVTIWKPAEMDLLRD